MKKNYFSKGNPYPRLNRWQRLLTVCLMLLSISTFGQVSAYDFSTGDDADLEDMTGSTQLVASASDDGNSALTGIGFTFNYNGVDYTQFSAGANGFVRLGVTPATGIPNYTNTAANAGTQSPVIMPYWDDLATGAEAGGGQVHYVLLGTAPNRTLVVEWFVTVPRATAGNADTKFQMWLHESTNEITFVYGNVAANTGGATIGLAGSATVYNTVNVVDHTNSVSTFTINTAVITAGRYYSFSPPACYPPSGIVVTPVAYTANISWANIANADEYEWIVVADNAGSGSEVIPVASGTASDLSDVVTGLTPSTPYDLYIRTNCGVDGDSNWSTKIDFTTTVAPSAIPWTEAFLTTASTVPAGWTTTGWTISNSTSILPNANIPYYIYREIYSTTTGTSFLTTNIGEVEAGNILSFNYSTKKYSDSYVVNGNFVVAVSADGGPYTDIGTVTLTSDLPWDTSFTYDLSAYEGQNVKVRITGNRIVPETGTSDFYLGFDNFYIGMPPACPNVTGLVIGNISATGVEMSWDEIDGADGYQCVITTSSTPPADGGDFETTEDNFYIADGELTPSTQYYLHVRTDCGGDYGNWATSAPFTTLCTTSSIPLIEGFNATTIPNCWTTQLVTATATKISFVASGTNPTTSPAEGSHFVMFNSYSSIGGSAGAEERLISPVLSSIDVPSVDVKFDWRYDNSNYTDGTYPNEGVQVQYSIDGGASWLDAGNFSFIPRVNAINAWAPISVTLPADAGDVANLRVAFKFHSEWGNNLFLDNVQIIPSPSCPNVIGLTIGNISATGAEMSWEEVDNAQEYLYAITTSSTPPADGDDVESTEFNYYIADGELTSNTQYYLHVRTNCGDGDLAEWATSAPFRTLCAPFTELNENFDSVTTPNLPSCWSKIISGASTYATVTTTTTNASAPNGVSLYNSDTAASGNIMLVTPVLSNLSAGTHRLKFAARNTTATQDLQIGVLTDPADASTFTLVQDVDITTAFQDYVVNFNEFTDAGVAIAIRRLSTSTYTYVYLDNIIWEPIPACADQIGLAVTNVTATGAEMSWENMGTVGYQYAITTSATPPASGNDTPNTYYIADDELAPLTTYYLHVRTACGDDAYGIWVSSSFKTLCLPPNVETAAGGTVCGQGTVELTATTEAGANIAWYANQIGGSKLGEGGTYTTPLITETTSYWVSAFVGDSVNLGPLSPAAQGGTQQAQTIAWNVNFTVTESTTLTSIDVFPVTSGGNGTIQLRQGTGSTVIATVPYTTTVGGGATAQTIELNFELEPGTYNLYPGTFPSGGITRNTSGASYPYTSSVASITGNGYDQTYFMGFYNWVFGAGCASPRTEVIATVTPAQPLTLSEDSIEICNGDTSDVVTLTEGASEYDTFVWEPTTGVSGDENGWTFNPTETTTYTLTASQSAGVCATSIDFTVTVNALPTVNGITASATEICEGTSVNLAANIPVLAAYCSVAFSNTVEPITLVEFEDISNATPATIGNGGALENFTAMTAYVTAGETYSITVNGNTASDDYDYTNNFWVYIDWNQNGVFTDAGETYSIGSITGNIGNNDYDTLLEYHNISVPATALNGNTRMRVLKKFNAATNPGSCNTSGFGQAEDYTVNVTGGIELDTYSWSDGVLEIGTDSALTVTPDTTTTYTVTVTNSNGCFTTETVTITVNGIPDAPGATSPQPLNEGQLLSDLVVTATGTLNWYTDAALTNSVPASTEAQSGTYWVTQTVGCESAATEITVEVDLGTDKFDSNSFRAYPNPTKSILNISYSKEISTVEMYNMIGQRVSSTVFNANEGQIDMSNLASGAYFIKVTSNNATKTVKVIKE